MIAEVFQEWIAWPKIANFHIVPVMDTKNDRYLLLTMGWDGPKQIYSVLAHLDIIDGKIWVQHDQTETGIANDLVDAGIPRNQIVLGFKSPERRRDTEFAIQ
ncbi:MAG: hypothetical protein OHK0029_43340 [Armatimonadaceae bacterium]